MHTHSTLAKDISNKQTPSVSVLIPVFNTAKYVRAAIESIRSQTHSNFELIAIDDGSNDDSVKILQQLAADEPRMRLLSRENRGLIQTRNELIAEARGEFIAWMDSDDTCDPYRLELQVAAMSADNELVCVGSWSQLVDPDGHYLGIEREPECHADILEGQKNGGGMRFATTMMRRQIASSLGGFREPFRIGEDLDFLLRLGESGKLANLSKVLYFYRQHLHSSFSGLSTQWLEYRREILTLADERRATGKDRLQAGETISIRASNTFSRRSIVSHTYAAWASAALGNGNRPIARKYARAAVSASPLRPKAWGVLIRVLFYRE